MAEAGGGEPPPPGAIAREIARLDIGACLTPSSIAAEMRPDLDPEEAAAIYTGDAPPPTAGPEMQYVIVHLHRFPAAAAVCTATA
jgi:hypothetical protein